MQTSSGVTVKLMNTKIVSLEDEPIAEFNLLVNDTLILGKVNYIILFKK